MPGPVLPRSTVLAVKRQTFELSFNLFFERKLQLDVLNSYICIWQVLCIAVRSVKIVEKTGISVPFGTTVA